MDSESFAVGLADEMKILMLDRDVVNIGHACLWAFSYVVVESCA